MYPCYLQFLEELNMQIRIYNGELNGCFSEKASNICGKKNKLIIIILLSGSLY